MSTGIKIDTVKPTIVAKQKKNWLWFWPFDTVKRGQITCLVKSFPFSTTLLLMRFYLILVFCDTYLHVFPYDYLYLYGMHLLHNLLFILVSIFARLLFPSATKFCGRCLYHGLFQLIKNNLVQPKIGLPWIIMIQYNLN